MEPPNLYIELCIPLHATPYVFYLLSILIIFCVHLLHVKLNSCGPYFRTKTSRGKGTNEGMLPSRSCRESHEASASAVDVF